MSDMGHFHMERCGHTLINICVAQVSDRRGHLRRWVFSAWIIVAMHEKKFVWQTGSTEGSRLNRICDLYTVLSWNAFLRVLCSGCRVKQCWSEMHMCRFRDPAFPQWKRPTSIHHVLQLSNDLSISETLIKRVSAIWCVYIDIARGANVSIVNRYFYMQIS